MPRSIVVRLGTPLGKGLAAAMVGLTLLLGAAREARAQEGFISPFVGYDFGGDANCPQVTGCEDKRLNAGLTFGVTGDVFGFEEEFAYAKDFFGTAPKLSSSVVTVMSNAMFIPKVGPVRPYFLAGLGLIKTHVESLDPVNLFTSENNNFGWDVGGGVMINVARASCGDLRYFHSFQDLTVLLVTLNGESWTSGEQARQSCSNSEASRRVGWTVGDWSSDANRPALRLTDCPTCATDPPPACPTCPICSCPRPRTPHQPAAWHDGCSSTGEALSNAVSCLLRPRDVVRFPSTLILNVRPTAPRRRSSTSTSW